MGKYIKEGEMVEGKKCKIISRKPIRESMREDPITNQEMCAYKLKQNSSVEVMDRFPLNNEETQYRKELGVHGEVGDSIIGESILLYVDNRRGVRFEVKEGQSGRHGANIATSTDRTIGRIMIPLPVYKKLLGYSTKSVVKKIENN